jgi:hypothetical protein
MPLMFGIRRRYSHGISRWSQAQGLAGVAVCVAGLSTVMTLAPVSGTAAGAAASRAHAAKSHYACSGPNSTKTPCHFSTPSGNIRCLWTPKPNSVVCELLSSKRAYRLRPTGKAKAVKLKLARRGQTLPTNQQLVLPRSMSCEDTRTTMTCNQDFGVGEFKLTPKGSHSS